MVYEIAPDPLGNEVAKVTELRIHGVGGTPPEDILENPHLRLVSGDRQAAFYQPVTRIDEAGPWHQREALSWGRLTAGDFTRALWVLLLPFALVNLAGWMHPPHDSKDAGGDRWDRRTTDHVVKGLVRIFGITVTFAFVLMLFNFFTDLMAYQCGNHPDCWRAKWWLTPLGWRFLLDHPTGRLVFGTGVCFLAFFILQKTGKRSFNDLEGFGSDEEVGGKDADLSLHSRAFWNGKGPVGRLRLIHWAVGLTGLAWVLSQSAPPVRSGSASVLGLSDSALALGFNLVCLALGLAAGVMVSMPQTCQRRESVWVGAAIKVLHRVASLVFVLALAYAALPGSSTAARPDRLITINTFMRMMTYVQVAMLFGLFLLLLVRSMHKQGPNEEKPAFFGLGPFVIATLGMFLLAASWAGGAVRIADLLGCPLIDGAPVTGCRAIRDPGPGPTAYEPPLFYAEDHERTAVGFLTVIAAITIGGLGVILTQRKGAGAREGKVLDDFGRVPPLDGDDQARASRYARKYEPWRMVRAADSVLTSVVLLGSAVAIMMYVPRLFDLSKPVTAWLDGTPEIVDKGLPTLVWVLTILGAVRSRSIWVAIALAIPHAMAAAALFRFEPLVTFSAWAITFLPLLLSAGTYAALRQPRWRRNIGVAWDVVTFWPRQFHPFAPPCYGERLVPQLRYRLEELTKTDCGRVLVSSHSQGTVVAVAALMQVRDDLKPRMLLFTYGSPLELLYRRYYPAYFGGGILSELGADLGPRTSPRPARWQHFYCNTDPLGYRMFESPPDIPPDEFGQVFGNTKLLDPVQWKADLGLPPLKMYRHSAYLRHPEFKKVVIETVTALRAELPDGSPGGPEEAS